MLKSPPFLIGLRYILARKHNRFVSFTSLISMAGLVLGVLAIIVTLSVFNGSQGIMRERTLITVSHGSIAADGPFTDWQAAMAVLASRPNIVGVAPYIGLEAMLSQQGYHQVTEIKAISPEDEVTVTGIADSMVQGRLASLEPGSNRMLLGRALANNLRLNIGDPVNLVVPAVDDNNRLNLNMHRFTVAGVFDPQFTIGSQLALIHIEDSKPLLVIDDVAEAVQLRLKVSDIDAAAGIVAEAVEALALAFPGNTYEGEDWSVTEASLFNALKMEKLMTWFMLMMIVAIGAFNIISTLVMIVSEKKADIAILRTMGASQKTIMAIFVVQGFLVGIIGTAIGGVIGVMVAANFSRLSGSLESLLSSADLFVITVLPAVLQASDVWITCTAALLISFLATLYPALKASQVLPAEVLRYE